MSFLRVYGVVIWNYYFLILIVLFVLVTFFIHFWKAVSVVITIIWVLISLEFIVDLTWFSSSVIRICSALILLLNACCWFDCHKQAHWGVPRKKCSENMQQIYSRTLMPQCDFNKVALQRYWNRTSAWVFFSCKFAAYFQNKVS